MRKYAPSKKFILLILGLLVIGSSFLIFEKFFSEKKEHNFVVKNQLQNKPVIAEEVAKDSDNDGLQDWEEALWKTDPNNPDTDSDGTPDGQEIKENRDPLSAAKDDKIKTPEAETTTKDKVQFPSLEEFSSTTKESLTEAISRQFFSDYLSIKEQKNGEALTKAEKSDFLSNFSDKVENSSLLETVIFAPALYTETDIKIAVNSGSSSIKEYGNNLAIILKKYFDPIPESEIAIFAKAIQNQDPAELGKIKLISDAYRNAAKEISNLAVPQNFAKSHLKLINNFASIAEDAKGLAGFFNDPITGFTAIAAYEKDGKSALKILRSINGYFLENKVVFGTNEAGKYFKNYQ